MLFIDSTMLEKSVVFDLPVRGHVHHIGVRDAMFEWFLCLL